MLTWVLASLVVKCSLPLCLGRRNRVGEHRACTSCGGGRTTLKGVTGGLAGLARRFSFSLPAPAPRRRWSLIIPCTPHSRHTVCFQSIWFSQVWVWLFLVKRALNRSRPCAPGLQLPPPPLPHTVMVQEEGNGCKPFPLKRGRPGGLQHSLLCSHSGILLARHWSGPALPPRRGSSLPVAHPPGRSPVHYSLWPCLKQVSFSWPIRGLGTAVRLKQWIAHLVLFGSCEF